ncbi:MAG: hypothetical protein IOD11_20500 [Rhodocyclaceae bacterium]|nr:hypothetical protein [Rhodocyclaceae bacterium]MCA3097470.1 hypothetical protein [Rhodocyclaceae bacterium]
MTYPVRKTRDELRAELPDVAAFVDLVRDAFGDQVRVLGIRTSEWTMGKPDQPAGIRLSECVWDTRPAPVAPAAHRRRA